MKNMLRESRYLRVVTSVLGPLLLSGCMTIGPHYQRPDTTDITLDGLLVEADQTTSPVFQQWWKAFGDRQLDTLVDGALKHNRNLLALTANLRAARNNLNLATLDYLPDDQVSARTGRSRQSSAGLGALFPAPEGESAQVLPTVEFNEVSFAPSWELDLFNKINRQRQIARAQYRLQEAELRGLQLMVIADVVSNYFRLQSQYVERAVIEKNTLLQQQSEDIVAKQVEFGRVSKQQLFSARAQRQATQSALPNIQADIEATRFRLSILTGIPAHQIDNTLLGVSASSFLKEPLSVGTLEELLERQPDILQAEQRVISANAEVGLVISQQFPSLSLTGSVGYSSENRDDLFEENANQYSYGPAINWSLTNLIRAPQRIGAARARKEAAVYNYEQAVLEAVAELNIALTNHQASQSRQGLLEAAAENAREDARISKLQYQAGASPLLQLISAEANLLQRELEAQRGVYTIIENQIAVFRVLGAG